MSGQNYAVLFSGGGGARGNNSRYYRTLKDVYTTLVEQHDFSPENITLLYADAGLGDTNINTRYNETSSEQFKFLKKSVANTDLVDELNDYYPARKKLARAQ